MPMWWNGRHKGLKIPRRRLRTGSSPVIGTIYGRLAFSQKNTRRIFSPLSFLLFRLASFALSCLGNEIVTRLLLRRYSVLATLVLSSPVIGTIYGRLAFSQKNTRRIFSPLSFLLFRLASFALSCLGNEIVTFCRASSIRLRHRLVIPNTSPPRQTIARKRF